MPGRGTQRGHKGQDVFFVEDDRRGRRLEAGGWSLEALSLEALRLDAGGLTLEA